LQVQRPVASRGSPAPSTGSRRFRFIQNLHVFSLIDPTPYDRKAALANGPDLVKGRIAESGKFRDQDEAECNPPRRLQKSISKRDSWSCKREISWLIPAAS
jgi:hypothetical protein